MGQITLKKKEPAGGLGNFKYTFECLCVPRPVRTIEVTAANDNEAQQLAQQECDEYCTGS